MAGPATRLAGRHGLAARLAISGLAGVYALSVWGSGLDRISQTQPMVSRLVPAPFRAASDRADASRALLQGNAEAARIAALKAVKSDPLHRQPAALLGTALLAKGQFPEAENAFRIAAGFGWREPLTQAYWYEAAIDQRDYARAAERVDAMLRANPSMPEIDQLLAPMTGNMQGRAALARRMAADTSWLDRYLDPPSRGDDALMSSRSTMIVAAGDAGLVLGCIRPARFATALINRGMRAGAEAVWRVHCPQQAPEEGLVDGGFEHVAATTDTTPFGWQRRGSGDLSLRFMSSGGGQAASVANSGAVSRIFLAQAVSLAQGNYLLRANVRHDGSGAGGRIVASLDCGSGAKLPVRVDGNIATGGQLLVARECAGETLALWIKPGSGEVVIDDAELVAR